MMFFTSDINTDAHEYQYAACETGCANSANWTTTSLTTVYEIPGRRSYHNNRYFALDPQGGPAFIYTDSANGHSGTFYAHCLAACVNAGNWFEFKLFEQSIGKPALAFAPNGQPRFAASYYVPDDPQYNVPLWKLLYGGCYNNCDNLGQSVWDGVFVYPTIGDGSFSLRIDTNGRPRIALYPTQTDLSQMQPGYLYYVWCDNAACLNAGDWNHVSIGTPLFYGDGVDLVLDPANRPRLAYQMGNAFTLIDLPISLPDYQAIVTKDYSETGFFLKSVVLVKTIDNKIWRFFSDHKPYKLESFNRAGKSETSLQPETLASSLAGLFQLPQEKISAALLWTKNTTEPI